MIFLLTILSLIAFTSFYQRHHDRNSFEVSLLDIIHRRTLYVVGILVGRSSNGSR